MPFAQHTPATPDGLQKDLGSFLEVPGLAEAASQVVGGCNPLLAAASRCPLVVLESFPKKRKGFIVPTQMRQRQSQIVGLRHGAWMATPDFASQLRQCGVLKSRRVIVLSQSTQGQSPSAADGQGIHVGLALFAIVHCLKVLKKLGCFTVATFSGERLRQMVGCR